MDMREYQIRNHYQRIFHSVLISILYASPNPHSCLAVTSEQTVIASGYSLEQVLDHHIRLIQNEKQECT